MDSMQLKHSGYIPVGSKGVPPVPVVYDLDWNNNPEQCVGMSAKAMIACATSLGVKLFKLNEGTDTEWEQIVTPLVRASRVQWCPTNGTILAIGSGSRNGDPSSGDPPISGSVSLLNYRQSEMYFYSTMVQTHNDFPSLSWERSGRYLAVARPLPQDITVFQMAGNGMIASGKKIDMPHQTMAGHMIVKFHPNDFCLVSCNPASTKIIVFWGKEKVQKRRGGQVKYSAEWFGSTAIEHEEGIFGMSFNSTGSILITIGRHDKMKIWEFVSSMEEETKPKLNLLMNNDGNHLAFRYRGCRTGHSSVLSVDASKWPTMIVTGGDDDTLLIYGAAMAADDLIPDVEAADLPDIITHDFENWPWSIIHRHSKQVNEGEVTCVKANPKCDPRTFIAVGGNGGFIHLFAYFDEKKTPFCLEENPYYYQKIYYTPEVLNWNPSTDDRRDVDDRRDEQYRRREAGLLLARVEKVVNNTEDLLRRHADETLDLRDEIRDLKSELAEIRGAWRD